MLNQTPSSSGELPEDYIPEAVARCMNKAQRDYMPDIPILYNSSNDLGGD